MNYKKIIKKRGTRFKILKKLTWIPDCLMVRLQYRIKMGFWQNLKKLKRFTEKLQLNKLKYREPVMPHCIDKYDVRDYIEKKGLGELPVECYGVYESADEINWTSLPDKFVAKKTTGGGGLNVDIVRDKASHDLARLKQRMLAWTKPRRHKPSTGREWAYMGIEKNRVIIEELLEDPTSHDSFDFDLGKQFDISSFRK